MVVVTRVSPTDRIAEIYRRIHLDQSLLMSPKSAKNRETWIVKREQDLLCNVGVAVGFTTLKIAHSKKRPNRFPKSTKNL